MTILLLLLAVFIAVGVSGCLGGDGNTDNSTDNNSSNNSTGSDDDLNYSTNIVTVRDLPAGYEFLSTQSVKSHGEGLGITDVLYGYRGYYKFSNDSVNNATVYFYCFKTNSTDDAAKYYQQMKDSYESDYSTANVSSITLNGHSATKFVTVSEDESASGPNMIAWTRSNLIFVVKGQVKGETDYATIESLAVASGL
ncbi:hypothetical protein LJC08_02055 [Methanimicrococcus sp. OttesenSCG-928-J09]|nr:hypothetical protein [Methanimicrococcus sp. OttesenSCG-928-J09]